MKKYGLLGKLKATKGNGAALAAILMEAAELVADKKGCHIYIVGQDAEDEDIVHITEVWDTKEDHDISLTDPAVRGLIGQAMPILDGMPQKGTTLQILGGAGLD